MKKYYYMSVAAAVAFGMTACSDDNDGPKGNDDVEVQGTELVYVLNQGNFYNGIEGGLSVVNLDHKSVAPNVFKDANRRSLGDTPQCGVAYGSKIYIGTSESNTIEILDRSTYRSIKQIRLSENPVNGTGPRSMVTRDGKIFISMYDGYLARLDTTTLEIDKSVAVGVNPENIAIFNDLVYVPLSEGMNYPDYGQTACTVNPATMQVERTFTVGLNPTRFIVTNGHLFCLCQGDYGAIASKLVEVYTDYTIREICNATMVAAYGDNVAIINQPFTEGEPVVEYKLYNTRNEKVDTWKIDRPDYANAMFYDERNDCMLISSYIMNGQYPSYDMAGYVNVYKRSDNSLLFKAKLGAAGPACMFTYTK